MEKVRMGAMPVGGEEGLRRSSRLRNRFSGFPSRSGTFGIMNNHN